MRGFEPLSRRLRRRSSRVFAMGLFPLAATSAPGRNLSSPVGSAASQRHVTPAPPSGMRRLGDRPPSSPIDTKTLARASMGQGEVAPRSFSERFSPKPPLADSASIFSHSRPADSILFCDAEGSRARPYIATAVEGSRARPCCGVARAEGSESSTVHARVETESKSIIIIQVPTSVVNSLGVRVYEERFHAGE